MIGKPEWFTYRVFGWGVRPKTKEGWAYLATVILLAVVMAFLPIDEKYKLWGTIGFVTILIIDVLHIMTKLDKHHDERERMHQLIIERNCSFAAIAALAIIAIYQSVKNMGSMMPVDTSILVVLGIMLLVKISSTIYVKLRM